MMLKASNTITNFYRLYKKRKMKYIQRYLYSKKMFGSLLHLTTMKFIDTVSDDDHNLMNLRNIGKDIENMKKISSLLLKKVEEKQYKSYMSSSKLICESTNFIEALKEDKNIENNEEVIKKDHQKSILQSLVNPRVSTWFIIVWSIN